MNADLSPVEKTWLRLVIVALLWVIRLTISSGPHDFAKYAKPFIDCALVALHWWANAPLRAVDAEEFGRNNSSTKAFLAPIVVAAYLIFIDSKTLLETS